MKNEKAIPCYMPDGTLADVSLLFLGQRKGDGLRSCVNMIGTSLDLLFALSTIVKKLKENGMKDALILSSILIGMGIDEKILDSILQDDGNEES